MCMIVDDTMKGELVGGKGKGYVVRIVMQSWDGKSRLMSPVMGAYPGGIWYGPGRQLSSRESPKPSDVVEFVYAGPGAGSKSSKRAVFSGFHVFQRRADAEAYATAIGSGKGQCVVVEVVFAEADVVAWGYQQWRELIMDCSYPGDEKLPQVVVCALAVTEQAWNEATKEARKDGAA